MEGTLKNANHAETAAHAEPPGDTGPPDGAVRTATAGGCGAADVRVPILIVGGSLVGLSTSMFLSRHGIGHLLVEKHSGTSTHPRGRGINVRSMELFRGAGVEREIRDAAAVLAENHGILQAGSLTGDDQEWLFREIDPGGGLARISPSTWCLCSQNDIEPVLAARSREQGADLRFGTELLSFEQDATGVTALVKDVRSGAHTTVRADYLVAADGPRSPVREQLRIGQSGGGELFHNVSLTFTSRQLIGIVGDRRFIVCYLTTPGADGALLPVDNRERWVFHAPWSPERGETLEDFTDERCRDHIRAAVGAPGLDVEITGKAPWHAAERVARRYSVGRVFLAGDSAHEMSPTGAFGSNTGIQDAHNLAWKLAAVLKGWAGAGLLDSYGEERQPVAKATGERASARSAEHSHPGYAAPVTPGGRQGGVLTVAMGYGYPRGAVIGVDPARPVVPERMALTGEPGTRAPHLWVRKEGVRLSTLDLYERSLVLLCGEGAVWRDAAHKAAARLSVPLDVYAIGDGSLADLVPEEGCDWTGTHGTTAEGALLVRPDGFVAWRSAGGALDGEKAVAEALAQVLRLGSSGSHQD
ncbi:FAD-dependent oxidoreductase [Streptomyces sp. NPDC020141]|uniref:FAD-dependent oxidoreductase n=1 Tax=Streptomyces sp. NPDC020141 TaxID=3365065 RepID=UPI0037BD6E98